MKNKKKHMRYKPLKNGDSLDLAVAISQATVLLDNAAVLSLQNNDLMAMLEVADRWIGISALFAEAGHGPDDDEVIDTNDNVEQYGFQYTNVETERGEYDDGTDESRS